MRSARAVLSVLILAVCAVPAAAQQPGACYRGRPPSVCRSFWITDATVGVLGFGGRTSTYLAAEVGWMRSVGDNAAIGAGLAGGYALEGGFMSLRPRYRRWLGPATALDAAVGVRWTPGRIEQAEVLVGVNWRDWGGVWGGIVADVGAQEFGWMVGAKTSSYAGVMSYVAGLVVGSIIAIALYPAD